MRGRNFGDVRDKRSSARLSVESAVNFAMLKRCAASELVTELLEAVHRM